MADFNIGIDWAHTTHEYVVLSERGKVVVRGQTVAGPEGNRDLAALATKYGGSKRVAYAVEPGAPRLVEHLVGCGLDTHIVDPVKSKRFRQILSTSKADHIDAHALAEALRLARRHLRRASAADENNDVMRRRVRTSDDLKRKRRACVQRLDSLFKDYYPGLAHLRETRVSRHFVYVLAKAYPTPSLGARAQERKIEKLHRAGRIRKVTTAEVKAQLGRRFEHIDPRFERACGDETLMLLAQLKLIEKQLETVDSELEILYREHPSRWVFESLPGLGKELTKYLCALIGDRVHEYDSTVGLRSFAGTCPVTFVTGKAQDNRRKSGKGGRVAMRRACHRGLQAAAYMWARCSQGKSRWARAYVRESRRLGRQYNTIIRSLADKWMKILWTLLTRGETYDEDRHLANLVRAKVWYIANLETEDRTAA